jgi:hypothetical protein
MCDVIPYSNCPIFLHLSIFNSCVNLVQTGFFGTLRRNTTSNNLACYILVHWLVLKPRSIR